MTGRQYRLLVMCTHPVQYFAPWLRELDACPSISLTVWYAILPDAAQQGVGFGTAFTWDVPLTDGYRWELRDNCARSPGLGHFFGTRIKRVNADLDRLAPDAVLVTGWHHWSLLQVAIACRRLGIPVLVRGDSNDIASRPAWKRMLQSLLMRLYDRYLVTGKANAAFYRARGVPDARLFDCCHFVDNARFMAASPGCLRERERVRSGWGANPGDTVFLFAGKLQRKKHPGQLLEAFQTWQITRSGKVETARGKAVLVFIGDGDLRASLEAASAGSDCRVHFAGFVNQSEIARCYAAADCLVLPSDSGETWGLVVNEAMACGIPAIVSDQVGCAADLVTDGETGYRYRFGSREELITRLAAVHADPETRRAMGSRARERIAGYSMSAASKGLLQALDSLGLEKSARHPAQPLAGQR